MMSDNAILNVGFFLYSTDRVVISVAVCYPYLKIKRSKDVTHVKSYIYV